MKVRQGFVSNSSSTSFTCDVCGVTEAGSDCCGIEEYGYFICDNGHEICYSDGIDVDNIEDHNSADPKHCPICQNIAVSLTELPYIMAWMLNKPLKQIKEEILELRKANGKEWVTKAIKFSNTNP